VGTGNYLQSRQQQRLQVRFSLCYKTSERMVSLLHVCDGRTLWMFNNLEGRPTLSRVDLQRLRQVAAEHQGPAVPILQGGGLPQLLGSLQVHFLASQPKSVVFQDVPVWAITLRWDPQYLSDLLHQPDVLDDRGRLRPEVLPEQLPDSILLLVGQDDLFPYHVDFRRSLPSDVALGDISGASSASRSLTTMELFEVQFDVPLDPALFVYQSGNMEIDDRTDSYLSELKSLPHD
jgi:hypothetical protein